MPASRLPISSGPVTQPPPSVYAVLCLFIDLLFLSETGRVDDVTSERLSCHIKEWPLGGESEPGLAACEQADGSERGEDLQNPG